MGLFLPFYELLLLLTAQQQVTTAKNAPDSNGKPWDLIVKTCNVSGAGTDARAYLKVFYQTDHAQETFQLDSSRNDFEQGQVDHFRPSLSKNDVINIGLFWWPSGTLSEHWCVEWVVLMNAELDKCFVGVFNRWIRHYEDPPTYAQSFRKRMTFAQCVGPPSNLIPANSRIMSDLEK